MKIGLLGYGKMGRAIEQIAREQDIEIAWRITRENRATLDTDLLRQADVVIEFSRPESAFEHVMRCLEAGVPVVCGTTGWDERLPEAQAYCLAQHGALLWASNFSIGVNLLFAVNRYLAQLMEQRPEYLLSLTEAHHIHKLDAPSGTALTLLREVLDNNSRFQGWALSPDPVALGEIPVQAIREAEIPGTHTLRWSSETDEITLEHRAHSRTGFAKGAVLAAQWLQQKSGFFSMSDVLGI